MRSLTIAWRPVGFALLIVLVGGTLLIAAVPWAPPQTVGLEHYSSVPISKPSREAALAAIEQLTNPSDITSLRAQATLGTSNLPSQDPVLRYLQTLANFSTNMQQIKSGLQAAQTYKQTGDQNNAIAEVNHVVALRNETGSLISNMYSLLNAFQSQPNVNQNQIEDIRFRIDGLQRLYIEYSVDIDQLKSQLTPKTAFLSISSSSGTVFVDEPLQVSGRLQTRNGTVLTQRNVTITWGSNRTIVLTDSNGNYTANIVFAPGFSSGPALIHATFQPNGPDAAQLVRTITSAVVEVAYYPTEVLANISPQSALPLDPITIMGNLSTVTGMPLENRTLHLRLDNNPVGNVTTQTQGVFLYTFQVPSAVTNGNHTLQVAFSPNAEIYAPSTLNVPLVVQRERITVHVEASSTSLLSGTGLTVNGRAAFNNKTSQGTFQGNLTVFLDGGPYRSFAVRDDGTFSLTLPIPLSADFGRHAIDIVYVPVDPRIDSSTDTVGIYVYNTPIVAVIAAAAVLATGSPLIATRKRHRVKPEIEVPPSLQSVAYQEIQPRLPVLEWEGGLKALDAETNASKRIALCYRLAEIFISNKLNDRVRDTETHREFYRRVVGLKPFLEGDLRGLVELFELAEYGPYRMRTSQGTEAEGRLAKIRDANWT